MSDNYSYEKKRRHRRYSVEGMDVHVHMLFTDEVELDNISVNGACIRAKRDLNVGRKYLIRIPGKQSPLYVGSAVVWKQECAATEGAPPSCKAGLRFLSTSPEDLVRLKDFMRTSGVPDDRRVSDTYRPAPLRFNIKANERAVLKCPEVLSVKKISIGGMLMGSRCALAIEEKYPFKLRLSGAAEPIKISGRIASIVAHSENMTTNYDIGVEFLSMDDSDRNRLDGFIRSLS